MKTTNGYLLVSIALMLVCFCAGAKLRFKRSESNGTELDLDSNGFCKTEKTWMEDCNQCFCVVNGAPACTLKGCIHGPILIERESQRKVKRSEKESAVDKKCVPGSKWTEVCNSCWCTEDGVAVCTKIGCVNLGK